MKTWWWFSMTRLFFLDIYLQAWSIRAKTAWIEWFGQIRAVISKQGRSCWAPPGDFYNSITKKAGPEDLCMIVQSQ